MTSYNPAIKICCVAVIVALFAGNSGDAFAKAKENLDYSSGRIKTLYYSDSEVYQISTKYGYQTNIVFAPDEEVQTISVGDRSLWQIVPAGNRLFIRPLSENITTNMTLLTNKHSYEFDLKSVGEDSEKNIYVARFSYTPRQEEPILEAKPVFATGSKEAVKNLGLPKKAEPAMPASKNYGYTYSGPDELAPQLVYDDGKSTFLSYKELPKTLPSIMVVGAGAKEYPVVPAVQGNNLVVAEVAGEIVARSPSGEVRIYNEYLGVK